MTGVSRTLFFADSVGVFQGGGCRAAAHAGAYAAASERGVHFTQVAGASAGAIIAAFIAAGAEPGWVDEKLLELDFKGLLRPPTSRPRFTMLRGLRRVAPRLLEQLITLVQHNGMYSTDGVEEWVEAQLQELLEHGSRPRVLFKDLRIPISIIAADLSTGRARIFSEAKTPEQSVAAAVRASSSLPFFFEPTEQLVDGGLLSNLPVHLARATEGHQRILAFALEDEGPRGSVDTILDLMAAVSDTVVRGAQDLQTQLQPEVAVININTGSIRATDFDKLTPEGADQLRRIGYEAVSRFFDQESVQATSFDPPTRTTHDAQTLDLLAQEMLLAREEVVVAAPDSSWVFELFSSLLLARKKGVRVRVALPEYSVVGADRTYQHKLLQCLGCEVSLEQVPAPVHAFLFDPFTPRATAVIYSLAPATVQATIHRQQDGDDPVVSLVAQALGASEADVGRADNLPPRALVPADERAVIAALIPVKEYAEPAEISVEEIPLSAVDSWARYAHSYKQRQQESAARVFRSDGLVAFEPAWATFADGSRSLIMPPVVEARGDGRFTVVNGVSRLLLLQREGRSSAVCAVVRNVSAPAPARRWRPLDRVSVEVGRRGEPSHRYEGFVSGHVRLVEKYAHDVRSLNCEVDGGKQQ